MPTRAPARQMLSGDQLARLRLLIDRYTEAQIAYAVASKGEMPAQVAMSAQVTKSNLDRLLKSLKKRVPDHISQEQ